MRSLRWLSIWREIEATKLADDWARAHPSLSRAALQYPPAGTEVPVLDSLESYVQARGFDVPSPHALRLLSHALTYPLTLASYVEKSMTLDDRPALSVAVVGARAESSLPVAAWAEVGTALPTVSRWRLLLLGPQVVPTRRLAATVTAANVSIACRKASLGPGDDLAAMAAETFDTAEKGVDVVALFNPGLGHPRHEDSWHGALAAIRRARPKALVVTSFSQRDLESDLWGLARFGPCPDWLVAPESNVFGSRRYVLDPEDETHATAANERAFVVRYT